MTVRVLPFINYVTITIVTLITAPVMFGFVGLVVGTASLLIRLAFVGDTGPGDGRRTSGSANLTEGAPLDSDISSHESHRNNGVGIGASKSYEAFV